VETSQRHNTDDVLGAGRRKRIEVDSITTHRASDDKSDTSVATKVSKAGKARVSLADSKPRIGKPNLSF